MNNQEGQKKKDFNHFLDFLIHATSRIEPHYFQLPVAGLEDPIYRERVYCYELYHQLRCILTDRFPYVLNGEVDKEGHPKLREEIGPRKPDFIVHIPRSMELNLAVIEVKPITSTADKFHEALLSLRGFLQHADYFGAIALVYGHADANETRWVGAFEEVLGDSAKACMLLRHDHLGGQLRYSGGWSILNVLRRTWVPHPFGFGSPKCAGLAFSLGSRETESSLLHRAP
jgi:hypothetical protein